MLKSPTISTEPLEDVAMDYEFLRRAGIRHLEQFAGQAWTDFNTHDPGITILEQLCYALTDLAYRSNYDIPDLLARDGEATFDSLYTPIEIFPTRPVTPNDLRKIIIDVPHVKNAWVEVVEESAYPLYFSAQEKVLDLRETDLGEIINLRGLYQVSVELSDSFYFDVHSDRQIYKAIVERLHNNRGLCEDFESIDILAPQHIPITARVEIEAVDDVEALLIAIYKRLSDHISPPVPTATLRELLAANVPIDEIFDGPLLQHGFIADDDLQRAQRRTEIRRSDIIREIMDVPGVRAVRSLSINGSQEWVVELDSTYAPKFDAGGSNIILQRNQIPVSVNRRNAQDDYEQLVHENENRYSLSFDEEMIHHESGADRQIKSYRSIQHQFPETYGIGPGHLPESAPPMRHAQAKQLKAYLMFFDQLLANYFAQLAHVRDLFSYSASRSRTYFSQVLDDPELEFVQLRLRNAGHTQRLAKITEESQQPSNFRDNRQNRFLNHLLARFAESFTDYSLIIYGSLRSDVTQQKLIADKQAFLLDYPQISSRRGLGFNYLGEGAPDNRSGLESRIRRKLGLEDNEAFYVVEHILLRPMREDQTQTMPFLGFQNEATLHDPFSLQISFVLNRDNPRFRAVGIKDFLLRTIQEETPAHISYELHWLTTDDVTTFAKIYSEWFTDRRIYWREIEELGRD